ncbi:MAG TPA: HAD family hydrolase, partial [Clostridia bacterium]|nr:HAD family hydrolase [Clostridia bacterium]
MGMLWETDVYLSEIEKQLDEIDVVSFDIFDTLLLRTVAVPDDIFFKVGKRLQEEYPNTYDFPPEVFAGMRREADAQARKKAWEAEEAEEITLDHIYEQFRLNDEYVACAKACELAVERENVYLNPNMADFISYCHKLGKKLALVSDSYLNRVQITELLSTAGLDLSLISTLIISCEYKVLKYNGKLFQILTDAFPDVPKARILHIGDNPHADMDGAACAGIRSAYYGMIPQTLLHYMSVERNHFGCSPDTVASLRKLAMGSVPHEYRKSEERFFFEAGCSVFGVIYTFFAEWI